MNEWNMGEGDGRARAPPTRYLALMVTATQAARGRRKPCDRPRPGSLSVPPCKTGTRKQGCEWEGESRAPRAAPARIRGPPLLPLPVHSCPLPHQLWRHFSFLKKIQVYACMRFKEWNSHSQVC